MRYILQVFPREDLAGCLLHGYKYRVIDYDGDAQDVSITRFQIKRLTLFKIILLLSIFDINVLFLLF